MSGFVLEWLYEGRVDIGLLYTSVDERGLKSVPVLREDLLLFASATARDVYLDHPAHKAAGARLIAACENGLAGLLVFDHEL